MSRTFDREQLGFCSNELQRRLHLFGAGEAIAHTVYKQ